MKIPIILSLGLLAFTGFADNPKFTVNAGRPDETVRRKMLKL